MVNNQKNIRHLMNLKILLFTTTAIKSMLGDEYLDDFDELFNEEENNCNEEDKQENNS